MQLKRVPLARGILGYLAGCLETSWHASAGLGTIYTFTIIRQNRSTYFRDIIPYVLAFVDLDEGFRIMTNVVGTEPEAVRCGMRVKVRWEDHEELALPLFEPA